MIVNKSESNEVCPFFDGVDVFQTAHPSEFEFSLFIMSAQGDNMSRMR